MQPNDLEELQRVLCRRLPYVAPVSVMWLAYGVLDFVVYPEHAPRWLVYRLVAFVPFLVLHLNVRRIPPRRVVPVVCGCAASTSIPLSLMVLESGGFGSSYYVGYTVVFAFCAVVFPMDWRRMAILALVLLGPYFVAASWHGGATFARVAERSTFLLTLTAFLVAGGELSTRLFVRERRARGRMRELVAALEEATRRDPLTDAFNRRYLEERLAEELALFNRRGVPFAFLLADLDHFKRLNDEHGHPAGDHALEASRAIRRVTRRENLLFRYGGEEFAVLLPATRLDQAVHAAEHLRGTVEVLDAQWEGRRIPLTVSVGVTAVRRGDDADAVVRRADAALYRAKDAGRNRVESA